MKPAFTRHDGVQFGSILGQNSLSDVQDLLATKDPNIGELESAWNAFYPTYPGDFGDWQSDFAALKTRWQAAKDLANLAIGVNKLNPLPNSLIPAQVEYDGLLKALKQGYPNQTVQKGDFDELYQRLSAMMGTPVPLTVIQPSGGDPDISILQATKPVATAVDSAASTVSSLGSFLTSPWAKVAALGGGLLALKILLFR